MLANIGVPGLILIIVLALIIFGPKRLPEMGRAVGQTLTEFKKSASNLTAEAKEPVEDLKKTIQPIRTKVGSKSKYSAMPAHTPPILRSF